MVVNSTSVASVSGSGVVHDIVHFAWYMATVAWTAISLLETLCPLVHTIVTLPQCSELSLPESHQNMV